jgi:serine/threonine-protein kinase RsbW
MENGPALIDGSSDDASGRRHPHPADRDRLDARCDVHLTLPARAGNVVLARRVVGTLAESLRMTLGGVEDVKLAVTEACTNVVRHAYRTRPGVMDVIAHAADGRLEVVVSDEGDGFHPRAHRGGPGLGLPLIAAMAEEFTIEQDHLGGTRIHMSFPAAAE